MEQVVLTQDQMMDVLFSHMMFSNCEKSYRVSNDVLWHNSIKFVPVVSMYTSCTLAQFCWDNRGCIGELVFKPAVINTVGLMHINPSTSIPVRFIGNVNRSQQNSHLASVVGVAQVLSELPTCGPAIFVKRLVLKYKDITHSRLTLGNT